MKIKKPKGLIAAAHSAFNDDGSVNVLDCFAVWD